MRDRLKVIKIVEDLIKTYRFGEVDILATSNSNKNQTT